MSPTGSLIEALNDALPQTQCTRCGFADCRGYAVAIATGAAEINQCPPGGAEGVARLAALTGRSALPLNPENGHEGPRRLAVIDEAWCIGCTLCLEACPVDCIVGAPKAMHTVIDDLCTGCELCIPVCPVDCIALLPVTGARTGWQAWGADQALRSAHRYTARRARLEEEERETRAQVGRRAGAAPARQMPATVSVATETAESGATERRQAVIDTALARAREVRPRR